MDTKFNDKRRRQFWVQTVIWYVFLMLLTYYLPGLMLFYVVCGVYDVSRNSNIDSRMVYRYFFGNGTPTWALAPFNILMDLITLPYINKKIYQLDDLPADYQQEIKHILDVVKSENIVDELASRVEKIHRGMIFFKWYGRNIENFYTIPAFHEDYKYIRTIGVSVFNKKQSTDEHYGPLRATIRILYNINDITESGTYIKVRDVENHWRDNKLFIFDDTLSHQSFNQTDGLRYCLFVDILRPSTCPLLMDNVVKFIAFVLQKLNFIFYGSWVPLK